MIHYTLDILAAFIGPLFGILLVDFYLIKKQKIDVDALFDDSPSGCYCFDGGVNWTAVKALVPATLVGVAITFTPALQGMANFAWFTGCSWEVLFFSWRCHGANRCARKRLWLLANQYPPAKNRPVPAITNAGCRPPLRWLLADADKGPLNWPMAKLAVSRPGAALVAVGRHIPQARHHQLHTGQERTAAKQNAQCQPPAIAQQAREHSGRLQPQGCHQPAASSVWIFATQSRHAHANRCQQAKARPEQIGLPGPFELGAGHL